MADAIGASHVQGAFDEGQPASGERPVLIAGKNPAGNLADLPIGPGGGVLIETSGSEPIFGTVTANQGTPNAGGANAWPVQGAGAAGAVLAGNPVRLGISDGTNTQDWRQAVGGNGDISIVGYPGVAIMGTSTVDNSHLRTIAVSSPIDGLAPNQMAVEVIAWTYGFDGSVVQRLRTPTKFKTATATASGSTALWTPTAGKKVRLLRYMIEVTANASLAAAGILTIDLLDSAATQAQTHSLFLPNAAGATIQGAWNTGWINLGNGLLSAAANNVLNINLSAALATGLCRVLVCGTEE